MMHRILAGTTTAVALLASGPGLAQTATPAPTPASADAGTVPVTADGAAALQAQIRAGLAAWFPATATDLTWTGDATVVPEGDVYRLTLPDLTVPTGDEVLAVGRIGGTLLPLTDGTIEIDLSVPATIERRGLDGAPVGSIAIGDQHFTGLWDTRIETLTTVEAGYSAITIARLAGGQAVTTATLGGVALTSDYQETEAGKWSGLTHLEAADVIVLTDSGQPFVGLGGFDFDLEFTDANFAAWAGVRDRALAATPADRGAQTLDQLRTVDAWLDGVAASAGVSGLTVAMGDGTGLELDTMDLTLALDGLAGTKSAFSLGFGHEALKTVPPLGAFNPDTAVLEIAAVDLPNEPLARAVDVLVRMLPGNPQAAALVFSQQVAIALGQASSQIKVEELAVDTPTTGGHLTGAARFTPRSVLGLTAEFDLVLRGIDEAMKAIEPKPGQSLADETQTALAVLGMLQAMGQIGKDEEGKPVRTYRIQLATDGRATLNGADLTAILGAVQPR